MKTEVEFIVNLSKEKFNELKDFFKINGKFKKEKERNHLKFYPQIIYLENNHTKTLLN